MNALHNLLAPADVLLMFPDTSAPRHPRLFSALEAIPLGISHYRGKTLSRGNRISRCLCAAMRHAGQRVHYVREQRVLARAQSVTVQGVRVRVTCLATLPVPLVAKLDSAFKLLANSPGAIRRFDHYVSGLYVREGRVSGFLNATRTIVLARELLLHGSPAEVASVIVHEYVHARFNAARVGAWGDSIPRMEDRCLRYQLEFLEPISDTEHVIAHLRKHVGTTWWAPALDD